MDKMEQEKLAADMPPQPIDRRGALKKRLAERYPDKDFEDDDTFMGQLADDYDSNEQRIKEYEDRERRMSDLFTEDPRSARMLIAWSEGQDPLVSLMQEYGDDIREALDDPERMEQMAEANRVYLERVAKSKALEDEYEKNIQESLGLISNLQEKGGVPEEEMDKAVELLTNIVRDGIVGKFSEDSLQMALKALGHDTDVEEARLEGEVKGRNAKIEEKLRAKSKGDGLPRLAGSAPAPTKKGNSLFSLAMEAK